jgi:ribose-phosphate pyrophosphokinase
VVPTADSHLKEAPYAILGNPECKHWNFVKNVFSKVQEKGLEDRVQLINITAEFFGDKEFKTKIKENVRGKTCFFIHDSSLEPGEWLTRLAFANSAMKYASASSVIDIIPYMLFSRQDRKDESRVAISARVVADVIGLYADRVITVDLHAPQIQGFYDIPLDNLYSAPFVSKKIFSGYPDMLSENLVVMSPDAGGAGRAKTFIHEISKVYNITPALVIGYKERPSVEEISDYKILGDVAGKDVMIIDDILDSGKTLVKAAENLKAKGANKIYAYVTHSLFTKGIEPLKKNFEKIFVSNTRTIDIKDEKLEIIDLSDLFAEGIYRTAEGESLSQLFE